MGVDIKFKWNDQEYRRQLERIWDECQRRLSGRYRVGPRPARAGSLRRFPLIPGLSTTTWRRKLEDEIRRWRRDPNYIAIMPCETRVAITKRRG